MPAIMLAIGENSILISARPPRLIRLFADYFHYYQPRQIPATRLSHPPTDDPQAINVELRMRDALPPREVLIPETAELFSQTGVLSMWIDGNGESAIRNPQSAIPERVYFHVDVAAFRVDVAAGKIIGLVAPEAMRYPHILANTYALFALLLMLRTRRLYHLHAAAIVSPKDELWLVCGAQRAGKTTLTTALGLAGWRPISDDSLLVGADDISAYLTPLKKDFHVGDRLFDCWPTLNEAAKRHQYLDRTCIGGLEFFGSRGLAETRFRKIDHIVLPQIVREPSSRIEPLSRSEALLRLAEQSMFFQLWRDHTASQWQRLNALSANAQCHRLFSSADMLANPNRAAEVLTQATT
ncbi:MAG: hypothetical protein JST85_01630 [Acidobacteria bacterium]|nr:hypothetical protein [Acidobacteriota bacterium]